MILGVAGLRIAVEGPVPEVLAAFSSAGMPDLTVRIADPGEPGPGRAGLGGGARLERSGARLLYASARSRGEADLVRREATYAATRPGLGVLGFLRFACGCLLLDRGGLLLHAAGIATGRGGYALLGASGAGKSTAARLAGDAGHRVLGDEICAVWWGAAGEALLGGTPFGGPRAGPGSPGEAPLAAIYLLEQAPAHARRPLPPGEVSRALLRHAVLAPGAADPEKLLATTATFATQVPGGVLSFRPDPAFLRLLC